MRSLHSRSVSPSTPTRALALSLSLCGALYVAYDLHDAREVYAQPAPAPAAQQRRNFYRLFDAIANNRVAQVRRRLPSSAQIDDIDRRSGATPLTWSLIATGPPTPERLEIIRMLLERGANPNARDNDGTSAMESAVSYPWPEVLRLLIANGGDVRVTATVGETTLLYPVCEANGSDWPGRRDQRLAIARILLEAGLDPTTMSDWARSHNHTAVDKCVVYDMPQIARLYVEHGGRPQSTLTSRVPRRAALARELNQLAQARARGANPARSPGATY